MQIIIITTTISKVAKIKNYISALCIILFFIAFSINYKYIYKHYITLPYITINHESSRNTLPYSLYLYILNKYKNGYICYIYEGCINK